MVPRMALLCRAALLVAALSPGVPAAGQEPPAVDSPAGTVQAADSPSVAGVPVIVRGDTVLRVYGRLGSFTAEERAAAIENRLRLLARTPAFVRDSAVLVEQEGVVELRAGESILMSVTPEDAAALGLEPLAAGEAYLEALRAGVRSARFELNVRAILVGLALTLLVSAGLGLALWAMERVFPVAYRWLRMNARRLPTIRVQRLEILSSARLAGTAVWLLRAVRWVATGALALAWLALVFGFFPRTRALSGQLVAWVTTPLAAALGAVVAYLPDLFTILVIVALTYWGLRLVRLVFLGLETGALGLRGFHPEWARPTYVIVRFLVVAFALVMIWPNLPRSESPEFKGVAAFLGLLVTFGAASAISNIVGGVVMIYMRPFQVGDRVKIADTVGDVIEKSLLVTRVRTVKHVEITIPNAMVLGSHIVNYSAAADEGGVILHTAVTIGYDAPWRRVHEIMLSAARDVDGLLAEPPPFVLQTALGDYAVTYELNAYTAEPNRMAALYSTLHQNLQDRFAEAGVEIMSPLYAAVREGPSTVPATPAPGSGPASPPPAPDPGC